MWARNLGSRVEESLADTPVVFIQGARQTGKSTLVHSSGFKNRRYFTLDDAATLAAAEADPQGFVQSISGPVTIDEVQRAPQLALALKTAVDADRVPGRFLVTGSANVLVLPRLADSLAGRMQIHTLWPLSQGEIAGHVDDFLDAVFAPTLSPPTVPAEPSPAIVARITSGGYPEVLQRADLQRRDAWFGSYITAILQRDVRDLANIRDLAELPRLLALIASRAGGLLDYADLARSLQMPQTTLKRYMALLEATCLVHAIPAWFVNIGKRLAKAPKVILNDTGLLAHLIGASADRLVGEPKLGGGILENFVALELLKQRGWSAVAPGIHHFRTHAGQEVDLVLENRAGRIVGIEVKSAASIDDGHFNGLRALADAAGDRFLRGIVLYGGGQALPFGRDLHALPLGTLFARWKAPE